MENVVVGIDIGSSKICTLVGKYYNNTLAILGKGIEPCDTVKKGIITDIEKTSNAIKNSIKKAETMAGVSIRSAYVNIIGAHIDIINNTSDININNSNGKINVNDVMTAFNTVANVDISKDEQIIDIIIKQCVVDKNNQVLDPLGMIGSNLELNADVIAAKNSSVNNIVKSMEMADVKIDGIVVEPIAVGEVLLSPEEKENTIIIDIGGNITNISLFEGQDLEFCSAIPVGGDNITKDIAMGLNILNTDAEKFKKQYPIALTSLIKNDHTITVTEINNDKKKYVKVSEIISIIEERLKEIFILSKQMLEKVSVIKKDKIKVLLTGSGVSYLDGCSELAQSIFNIPVNIAKCKNTSCKDTECISATGIIKFIFATQKEYIHSCSNVELIEKTSKKEKSLFSKLLKFIECFF